jgi:hypothetical protein
MNKNSITKIMLNFRTNGQRRLGRPWKRLLGRPKQVHQGLTSDDDDENHSDKNPIFKQFYCLSQFFENDSLFPTFLSCF